jgi:hypothetical protein
MLWDGGATVSHHGSRPGESRCRHRGAGIPRRPVATAATVVTTTAVRDVAADIVMEMTEVVVAWWSQGDAVGWRLAEAGDNLESASLG